MQMLEGAEAGQEEMCKTIWDVLNPRSKVETRHIHGVGVVDYFSLSFSLSMFLFHWPSPLSGWHGPGVCVHLCSAIFTEVVAHVSVSVYSRHVSWVHDDGLGLELMCSSTCEMRTRGPGTGRGGDPSNPHQAAYRHKLTLYTVMVGWYSLNPTHFTLPRNFYRKPTWQWHFSESRL